jgi:methylated-DNA-[protein]-cysteine S-methyltransferase
LPGLKQAISFFLEFPEYSSFFLRMAMAEIQIKYFQTIFGKLILGSFDGNLCLCDWLCRKNRAWVDTRIQKFFHAVYVECDSGILQMAEFQLEAYFHHRLKSFDLPLFLAGTEFQKRAWNGLIEIPYGKTETYRNLSLTLGNPAALRAIASAIGANPLAIVIPCHRVIGSHGEITGYSGGVELKRKLLELEMARVGSHPGLFEKNGWIPDQKPLS